MEPLTVAIAERLAARTEQPGADECWEWQGARSARGYGQMWVEGRLQYTHRLAYQLTHGEIPGGLCILHSCDNPPCCNPAHLSCGTQADNLADMRAKGRWRPRGRNVSSRV